MIPKAVTLLLFAAAAASGRIAQGPKSHPHQMVLMPALSRGCPTALEPAPLICKFLQPDLDFQYKPQLIAPSTYIPPLVVEKCDHPELDIEIPAPIKKPIVIPEAPVLPPITIPKFPVPVLVEKPLPPPVPIAEPCEPAFVPEVPVRVWPEFIAQPEFSFDEAAVPEIPYQPLVVPQPPALSEFIMPDLPVRVEVAMAEPCLDDLPIPVAIPEYIPPVPMPLPIAEHAFVEEAFVPSIPAAPVLPPFEMPALPEIVLPEPVVPEIAHQDLVVQPVKVELPIAEPCLEEQPILAPIPEVISYEPFIPEIPMAPVLPPFEMPALPEIEAKPEPPAPFYQPIAVPQAPVLPSFVIPELPVRVEAPMTEPCLEDQPIPIAPTPEYIPSPVSMLAIADPFKPAFVLSEVPAVFPPFKIPGLPEIVAKTEPAVASYIQAPLTPELPAAMMPAIIAPCPEDQLPVVSIPEFIHPLAPIPKPEIPFKIPYQPMWVPMDKPDRHLFGKVAMTGLQLPKLPKPVVTPIMPMDPCEPSSKPGTIDLPYFVRYPSYLPATHGDYYNHLPRMDGHMRNVLAATPQF